MKKYYLAMAILAAVSLAAVIWHYAISRGAAGDERKVSDINTLQMAVDEYAQDKGEAPDSLSALTLDDKVTKRLSAYEYSHGSDSFTICTTFATDVSNNGGVYGSSDSPYWHKKGRQCFTSDIYVYTPFLDSPSSPPEDLLNNYDYNGLYQ